MHAGPLIVEQVDATVIVPPDWSAHRDGLATSSWRRDERRSDRGRAAPNRITSVMREMDYHFFRSGYSTIVRESRDFSCIIVDAEGRLVVAPWMFFHGPVYFHLVQRILALYGAENLREGDVFVTNHPYEGNMPHASDMGFAAPIVHDGRLVAFAATIAHKADVGGRCRARPTARRPSSITRGCCCRRSASTIRASRTRT